MASGHPLQDDSDQGAGQNNTDGSKPHGPDTAASEAGLPGGWRSILAQRLREQVLSAIASGRDERLSEQQLRPRVARLAEVLSLSQGEPVEASELQTLVDQVLEEVFGYGPIQGLMTDQDITDILINGPRQVFTEKRGQLQLTDVHFRDEDHLLEIVERMLAVTNRSFDPHKPLLDARLPDGSRLNLVTKPPALNGPLVSIRRFGARPLTAADLVANESVASEMLEFLSACIKGRINIIISGGTGSGKTTLLNALSRFIPESERVVTIEDTAELELQQRNVAKMESQIADPDGQGAVSMRDLLVNSLRMRPDRIIVGECRGAEALDMLQAMNTGHEGSLTTIHANTPRDALARIELMVGLAGVDIPVWAVRKLMASSINLVVQVSRMSDGKRKIVSISEITGMEGDVFSTQELFQFCQSGVEGGRVVCGEFRATGLRPRCLAKLSVRGANLPVEFFTGRVLKPQKPGERRP
jgi:pilus assembly protein CpaF